MNKLKKPKILIGKKYFTKPGTHFYSYYNYPRVPKWKSLEGNKRKPIMFNLHPIIEFDSELKYPHIPNINTERDLLLFILKKFGPGTYRIQARASGKGQLGIFTMWNGTIDATGYTLFKKESKGSLEAKKLKNKISRASTESEATELKEELIALTSKDGGMSLKQVLNASSQYGTEPWLKRTNLGPNKHTPWNIVYKRKTEEVTKEKIDYNLKEREVGQTVGVYDGW